MGAISAPSHILVTGANGFIASHCVVDLLASGFTVVGTVRNEEKKSRVLRVHKNHPNLEIAIVPDLTLPTAFDEAIGGCDGVLHLAAPFNFSCSDFEAEMLKPSIDGSKAICLAATKEKRVQRVVVTSSVAAVYDSSRGLDPGKVWTEKSWAPLSYEDGKNAAVAPMAYRASKVLGEKTAWEFLKENHPQWDLVALCPGMVFGNLLDGSIDSVKELNTSNQIIWGMLDKEEVTPTRTPLWTSVTLLARAHTLCLTHPSASNERFLICRDFDNQQLVDIIHASPNIPDALKARFPLGNPGESMLGKIYSADSSKIKAALGIDLEREDETLAGAVEALVLQMAALAGKE